LSADCGIDCIAKDPSGCFMLLNDLTINETIWNDLCKVVFTGVLEGNNFTIEGIGGENNRREDGGLHISRNNLSNNSEYEYGLFAEIGDDAVISNLKISKITIEFLNSHGGTGLFNVGILCGTNKGVISYVSISDCVLNIQRDNSYIGCVAGTNYSTITNCTIKNLMLRENGTMGGICGRNVNDGSGKIAQVLDCEVDTLNLYIYMQATNKSFAALIGDLESGEVIGCSAEHLMFRYMGSNNGASALHNHDLFGGHPNDCGLRPYGGWLVGRVRKGSTYDSSMKEPVDKSRTHDDNGQSNQDWSNFGNNKRVESTHWFKDNNENVGYNENLHD